MIKIACAQYQMEQLPDLASYVIKIEKLITEAKKQGATLLVLPEYAGVEIACNKFDTDEELYNALEPLVPKYIDFYQKLAKKYDIYIQAGTIVEKISSDKYSNRAYLFSPTGSYGYQDKLQLTQFEHNLKLLQRGSEQKIFVTPFGKIAIAVCYDSEFPEIVRRLVQQGASIILVPSYTTSVAGYNRVFLSCRARAIENQCYMAVSFTVGKVDLSDKAEDTYGQAAIFSPADTGFPDDGVVAQGTMNKPMLVCGDVALADIDRVRQDGQVLNFHDTEHCLQIEKNKLEIITL